MYGQPVIVSACLVGIRSRYDGTDSLREGLVSSLKGAFIIPVCPEQLGGLPTPRPRAEITVMDRTVMDRPVKDRRGGDGSSVISGGGRVVDENGKDVTGPFIKGAEEVLKIARITGAKVAVLREKSPSCGVEAASRENPGPGVTAALLKKEGIEVKGVE
jgi:uncharacterized protein YbbK (DUF523 family)